MTFATVLRAFEVGLRLALAALLLFTGSAHPADRGGDNTPWVGSWAASQQLVEPSNALNPEDLRDATLRQVVHLSLGGTRIRVRLSNRFGTTPLRVAAAHIARPIATSASKIAPGSDQPLTFSGAPAVTIPPNADYISDPVVFLVDPLSDVAITLHFGVPPAEQTGHPGSRATSYLAPGDLVSQAELPSAKSVDHWYFIAGIDVAAPPEAKAVVALGDSITDGHGATTNGNDRWTDLLAHRLQTETSTRTIAVLNQGIGGNHLLTNGSGPNILSRFDSDVIAQPRVRYLILLVGINDIGMLARTGDTSRAAHDELVHRIIGAYEQVIARAHAHDIQVIGGTLLPFAGSTYYHPGPASEADRQAANEWIRAAGHFDAVIDFDRIARDPEHLDRLLPAFDSGDHLHPSAAGYAAMAQGVPLSLFAPSMDPALKTRATLARNQREARREQTRANAHYTQTIVESEP